MIIYSFKKQYINDPATFKGICGTIVLWICFVLGLYLGWLPSGHRIIRFSGDIKLLSVLVGSIVSVIFLAILIARILKFKRLCFSGNIVNGTITKRDNLGPNNTGRIIIEYAFKGEKFKNKISVRLTSKYSGILKEGEAISVIVNPKRPKKSYVRELIDKNYPKF